MERHNLTIKGSRDFLGYVEIGRDMLSVLTREFVKLVYEASTNHTYPRSDLPILEFDRAHNSDTFMKFYKLVDYNTDVAEYQGGWLMNSISHISEAITPKDIADMEKALQGEIEDNPVCREREGTRDVLLRRTNRFHHLQLDWWKPIGKENCVRYIRCDCRDYYFTRWCFQSAYMQHRAELQLLGEEIKSKGRKTASINTSVVLHQALAEAEMRVWKKKQAVKETVPVAGEEVLHVLTQD
jgi:hypothetical protein